MQTPPAHPVMRLIAAQPERGRGSAQRGDAMIAYRDLKRIRCERQRKTDPGVQFCWNGIRPRRNRETTQAREALDQA